MVLSHCRGKGVVTEYAQGKSKEFLDLGIPVIEDALQ